LLLGIGAVLYRYANIQIALVAPPSPWRWRSGIDSLTASTRAASANSSSRFLALRFTEVVQRLVDDPAVVTRWRASVMTYIFSDIESFTTMAEG